MSKVAAWLAMTFLAVLVTGTITLFAYLSGTSGETALTMFLSGVGFTSLTSGVIIRLSPTQEEK